MMALGFHIDPGGGGGAGTGMAAPGPSGPMFPSGPAFQWLPDHEWVLEALKAALYDLTHCPLSLSFSVG